MRRILFRVFVAAALLPMPVLAGASHFEKALESYEQRKFGDALKEARDELSAPAQTNAEYLAQVRAFAILALATIADLRGHTPADDEEVAGLYQEGLSQVAVDSDRAALLHSSMRSYYSATGRSGQALRFARLELSHSERTGQLWDQILALDAAASIFADMGELTLRDRYRARALDLAAPYLVRTAPPSAQWVEYARILARRMRDAALARRADEVRSLWARTQPIVDRHAPAAHRHLAWLAAAEKLALAGAAEEARGVVRYAKGRRAVSAFAFFVPKRAKDIARASGSLLTLGQLVAWDPRKGRREDLLFVNTSEQCTYGAIHTHLGEYTQATRDFERCFEDQRKGKLEIDPRWLHLSGVAHEEQGRLDAAASAYRQAIASFETARSSFTVAERAAFFRSDVRASYWGLIRVLARRAATSGSETDFIAALQASELVRARQLGDLLEAQGASEARGARPDSIEMQRLRAKLGPSGALLDYILTERHVVLLGVTQERQQALVIETDMKALVRDTTALARELASAASDRAGIDSRLAWLSTAVLTPARGLLEGKTRLVVLPDGVVNAIPFELLGLRADGLAPLIEERVVSLQPSVHFFLLPGATGAANRTARLFGMADPAYARSPEIQGLVARDLAGGSRGSAFLSYFTPLPETRKEAEAIGRLFGEENADLVFGAEATESALKRRNLLPFRFLHFATHGILGNEVPGVAEPALVLADEPNEDGLFTASEASGLKLDADLTVLSACNTGSGEYYPGEGVMGMSRAFLAAGSRSVLVSLWPVDSNATVRLMVAFYRHLRAGKPAAAALRQAKLDMIAEEQGPLHPFFWAAFVLVGSDGA